MLDNIVIRGAREHNLKSIDVTIPRNKMVVITGISGSGKSSLAFDTIYAEGQRRYVESLSAYARQFLEMMKKPDLDLIEGLSPAISIEQKTVSHNPRSTVATVTEIYDYMRLLWARVGVPYSPVTGKPIASQTVSQMVDRLMEFPDGTKLMLLAPVVSDRKGEFTQEIAELRKKGYERLKVDGTVYNIDEIPPLKKTMNHSLAVVVDRVVMRPGLETRLAGSLEKSLELANGLAIGETIDGHQVLLSSKFACPVSGFTIAEIEPRLFSFNNPAGACPECSGLGMKLYIDPNLIIPDRNKSLDDGAVDSIAFFSVSGSLFRKQVLPRFKKYGVTPHTPVKNIPEELMQIILYGLPKDKDAPKEKRTGGRWAVKKEWGWEGIINNIERRYRETLSEDMREEIEKFQSQRICEACNGKRLRPEPLSVKIAAKDIAEITMLSIEDATEWFTGLNGKLPKKSAAISTPILKEINDRLGFLNNVGLGYLALSRRSGTLSGGEGQRIRLASQIGSGLSGVLYVLDEPSIGLHQRDNDRLLATLKHLRDLGNTVIVVEHDTDAIMAADYIFDMGPGAGAHGGHIVAEGAPAAILANKSSITGQFLSGKRSIAVPDVRRKGNGSWFKITGARANNLKNVNASFPLGTFVCVTGVSGGGKSSLVIETLYKGVNAILNHSTSAAHLYGSMSGVGYLDKVIDIDQAPIGRTPRSNPATYVGAFEVIRNWFCKL
ncbi:MAG: excinuclease ABC subunit UvrA, partial [Alphaproteobacteria bacterium]|nr:excinuclease ABC subunit UvrA [Alphaproteobacteria bacterium]